jgi:hypothetical protein
MRIGSMRNLLVLLAVIGCAHSQNRGGGGGGGGGLTGGNAAPVPADVRKTVDAVLGPTANVTSEQEGGVTIYEAAIQTKLEIEVSDTGQLQRTEVALPVAALPTAVTSALAGKGKISEAEVVVSATGVAFEIEIGDQEIVIDAAGKILEQHREVEDTKDDDD